MFQAPGAEAKRMRLEMADAALDEPENCADHHDAEDD